MRCYPPPRSETERGRGTTRSVVEGACGAEAGREADAPSTALRHSDAFASRSLSRRPRAAYAPRFAGQDGGKRVGRLKPATCRPGAGTLSTHVHRMRTNLGLRVLHSWGKPMIRPSAALTLWIVVVGAAALAGCAGSEAPLPSEPSFYQNLAHPDMTVDAAAAASMISGYRSNNGLGAVTVDPELMRMASEQAMAMASHDKMDHDIGRPFRDRVRSSPFSSVIVVENISAGYHTLAEAFSGWRDSPPHRANMLKSGVSRLGIAAAYAPNSKYKLFWALILAGDAHHG